MSFAVHQATVALEDKVINQLVSINTNRKIQVEDYFNTIRSQVTTLSSSTMMVDAMRDFTAAFHQLPQWRQLSTAETADLRAQNADYYSSQFGAKFETETGRRVDVSELQPADLATTIAQNFYISSNPNPLGSKEELNGADDDSSDYTRLHRRYHPVIRDFLRKFEYYDIFLVDPDTGHIVYSVFKELDYATSLLDGPYKDTNFARVFRQALQAKETDEAFLVDFEPYVPSYDAPASFISSPIFDDGEMIGVLIFQMPVGRINAMLQQAEGLGESGETYLVSKDLSMRSQSRFKEENTILTQKVDSPGARAATSGTTGTAEFADYRGIDVVSAFAPIQIDGLDWGILTEIDDSEAFSAIGSLRNTGFIIALLAILATTGYALYFARGLTGRIRSALKVANNISHGNFDSVIEVTANDEVGELLNALRTMQTELFGRIVAEKNDALRITQALKAARANVVVADATDRVVFVNDAMLELSHGFQSDFQVAVPGFNADELVGSRASALYEESWAKDLAGDVLYGERHMQVNASAIHNDSGELQGCVYEFTDLTEQRNAEAQIARLLSDAVTGELGTRLDTTNWQGSMRELGDGVNRLMNAIVEPISVTAEYLQRISKGDIPLPCDADFKGQFALMRDNLNTCISAINLVLEDTEELSVAAVAGELSRRADASRHNGRFRSIVDGVNDTMDAVVGPVEEILHVMEALASNRLTEKMQGDYKGDFAKLRESVNISITNLGEMVQQIAQSALRIAASSSEISKGNQDLSARTEQQAANIEETAASMEEITVTVKKNADNARQASQLAGRAYDEAQEGGGVVEQAVTAMEAIESSSRRIGDIISVIDQIAFQTNLLALNSAVEAARAGEQGRGFAVVATEVRSLAQRSATAAKEINLLIQESVGKVNSGSELVARSGASLDAIIRSVKEASSVVSEIASASMEQSLGIEQVNKAVVQMDDTTQRNAGLVEQATTASAIMAREAESLRMLTERFVTGAKEPAIKLAKSA